MRRLTALAFIALAALVGTACGSRGSEPAEQSAPKNPWFPLEPGTIMRYRGVKDGKSALDVFTVTHRTKTIQARKAAVVRDRLYLKGKLAEDTVDWYSTDARGNVWYLGEDTRELNARGGVETTAGSWQAGVDGARAGIFMSADPRVGQRFHQEFYAGEAEDQFQILGLRASVKVPAVTSRTAMRTKEWTRLEPGVVDNKYYVRGIGTVVERTVMGGDEHLDLISITHG